MPPGIEQITHQNEILAIVIRSNFNKPGVTFATPDEYYMQLGIHNQKKGAVVKPHVHMPFDELKNIKVQEMFHIADGKIKVNLYNQQNKKVKECVLNKGDTILLIVGHGIEFLEDTRMVEIKQGPYRGQENEKRFIDE